MRTTMAARAAALALALTLAAPAANAMVEYRQKARDAARDGGCEPVRMEAIGQIEGALVYAVDCADDALTGQVACNVDGCVFSPDEDEE